MIEYILKHSWPLCFSGCMVSNFTVSVILKIDKELISDMPVMRDFLSLAHRQFRIHVTKGCWTFSKVNSECIIGS